MMLHVTDEDLNLVSTDLWEEQLSIEWFEAGRSLIKRETMQGTSLQLQRRHGKYLSDGQVIYQDDTMYVRISTLPCTCMVLTAEDPAIIGDFCYDVGNRHLPVFCVGDAAFGVAYDARLYEALASKFGSYLRLEQLKLLPDHALLYF